MNMAADLVCVGSAVCGCTQAQPYSLKRIVLTGGPSAGKTDIFERAKTLFCRHVAFVPEGATIAYQSGLQRGHDSESIKAAQRQIFSICRALREKADTLPEIRLVIFDRGALDGLAYWPGSEEEFWAENGSSRQDALAYFDMVIHLRTPMREEAYNLQTNSIRTESAQKALELDQVMAQIWEGHPQRMAIAPTRDFEEKIENALRVMKSFLA